MKQQYVDWIANWLLTNSPASACAEATLEMQKAFPELKRFRGYFKCLRWAHSPHWWLKDMDTDEIVDPTVSQFIYISDDQYEYYDESLPEPKGKCINCGELSYFENYSCSEECSQILHDELNGQQNTR